MIRLGSTITLASLLLAGVVTASASPAEARDRVRVIHGHGPNGGAYHAGRAVSRQPGSTQVRRGAITGNGRGYRQTRSTDWGDGQVQNDVRRTYRNGAEVRRDATYTRNGDGSASVSRNRTGAQGNSQSGWSTVYRTDDGYSRTRGATTSSGRGYTATRDVSVGDDYVTVQRSRSNARGDAVDSTRSYRRPK
ncbi:hypothetical protein V5F89_01390 [Pelagerythrobacter marensis]|uniref:Uncharacterized protein n=1 Tax=Pelagerythrobacter marensis TaxID=543877 RepID=A0ABZ2D493_9SPHN